MAKVTIEIYDQDGDVHFKWNTEGDTEQSKAFELASIIQGVICGSGFKKLQEH